MPRWVLEELASKAGGDSITPPVWDMRDDLAVMGLGGLWEMAGVSADDPRWSDWYDRATAAIGSQDAATTQRVADHLIARPGNRGGDWDRLLVDPVTMDVIDGRGANPVMLALMTRLHDDMVLEPMGGEGGQPLLLAIGIHDALHDGAVEPFLLVGMDLGGVSWECDRVEMLTGDIPATLAIAIEGRPLRDVVSHRLLDRHDMTVVEWSAPNLIIRHDGEIRRVLDWTPNGRRT